MTVSTGEDLRQIQNLLADEVFFRSSDRVLYSAGVYRDAMRRAGEGWKLARREIEIQLRHED